MKRITLRHLIFLGPSRPPATIFFNAGLNVLYGASETGKSFVLEAINFMLGGSDPLRDIPERVGYDQVLLGIDIGSDEQLTLVRATQGGQYHLYQGLHQTIPTDQVAVLLAAKHSSDNNSNLSVFLLEKINLSGKTLKKNASGATRNLSFRDLTHLCIIDETDIQKKGSPIEQGQYITKTAEYSLFKLLLTGIDDSALVTTTAVAFFEDNSIEPKIELLDELITSIIGKLSNSTATKEELLNQLDKIEVSLASEQPDLNTISLRYREMIKTRDVVKSKIDAAKDRQAEVGELVARFLLLNRHYQSDLERLEGIKEVGSLLNAFKLVSCPLCGALPDHQHPEGDAEGNIELVIAASNSESEKIERLQRELTETISQLDVEGKTFETIIPGLSFQDEELTSEISKLSATLSKEKGRFFQIMEAKSRVLGELSLVTQIEDFKSRRSSLIVPTLETGATTAELPAAPIVELSTSVLSEFAQLIENILIAWNFPDADRIYFDESTRDIIISGKRRGSRGKGMRSITHAAFSIGILEYCLSKNLAHPGFLVIDSPLLAYREPEDAEDDLTHTDVQDKFYGYLFSCSDKQIIIIENVTPPEEITSSSKSLFFSKNSSSGRYGFFPIISSPQTSMFQ